MTPAESKPRNIKHNFSSSAEKILNFVAFPFRAFVLNPNESGKRLMCLRDERMHYVKRYCRGRTLDVGCGPWNVFCAEFLDGKGEGVDFHQYPGLEKKQVLDPPLPFPQADASFDTVTLIANVNHIPESVFDQEIKEISRVLAPGGRLLVTRIGLLVSFMTHNVVKVQSKLSDKYYDMDTERGIEDDERLTVSRKELDQTMGKYGLKLAERKRFWTQWALNELLIFEKRS